jgi:ubiquinone/menaquinone biosynthesis C-methylase UbiE
LKCRHCSSDLNLRFLDLGSAPPSNAYLTSSSLELPEIWYPLSILACENCWLVQTEDHAGRESLFSEDYAYFSSYSSTWLEHARNYVETMVKRFGLTTKSCIVEVAANDGYLLQYVQEAQIPCYGIEPTSSTAAAARNKGIEIISMFFGVELAEKLLKENKQADLIIANNVLAHVPDINDFVAGFYRLLKSAGVATFEFPHVLSMVQENQFDTAYHEHYSYLSLTSVQRIFAANGLTIFDVQKLTTHGGSLRVFAQRSESGTQVILDSVSDLLKVENEAGIRKSSFYKNFQTKAEKIKDELVAFLIECKKNGVKVGAYGAAAKGNTLLNFAGIRPDLLPYVVDKNPAKLGKFMPGSRIPIVNEDYLRKHKPNIILILPWNLKVEIMEQLSYINNWGGKFVSAVPHFDFSISTMSS